jgi:hypothetical protein
MWASSASKVSASAALRKYPRDSPASRMVWAMRYTS